MKQTLLFLILHLAILLSCQAQTNESAPGFGKYYRIGTTYTIKVPFAGQPNSSPKQPNDVMDITSCQYAYPKVTDDVNILYGVDVVKFKNEKNFPNAKSKTEYVAGNYKLMYEKAFGGMQVKGDTIAYHGVTAIRQKIRVKVPNVAEVFVQSLVFPYKDLVIRMYTFTPLTNGDNKKIGKFYETIRYK